MSFDLDPRVFYMVRRPRDVFARIRKTQLVQFGKSEAGNINTSIYHGHIPLQHAKLKSRYEREGYFSSAISFRLHGCGSKHFNRSIKSIM